jgi:type IV secretion system protein VirD4
MRPALTWLPNPHARAATKGNQVLNVAQLLRTRGTVYLLGAEDGSTASLVAALTGYIAREARRIADLQPGGRLDPSLLLALDEAALICPIPLDRWSADMGGRGIQIIAAFQSRAQAIGKWGATGAAELINNAGAIVLFGGCKDEKDLHFWSSLFGDRDEEVVTTNSNGEVISRSVRKVAVFSPAQLASLPKFKVVVWRSSMLPVMGKVDKFWTRPEHRALLATIQQAEQDVLDTATDTTRRSSPIRAGLAAIRRRRTERLVTTAQRRARGRM